MRLFVAFDLEETVKAKVSEAARHLRSLSPPEAKIAWISPENYHVTLKFIGETNEENSKLVEQQLVQILAGEPVFEVNVRNLGAFPNPRSPRVIWVGVEDHDDDDSESLRSPLMSCAQRLDDGLEALGIARDSRQLSPHLTLARVKEATGMETWASQVVKSSQSWEFGPSVVNAVTLYESNTETAGATYRPILRVPLKWS